MYLSQRYYRRLVRSNLGATALATSRLAMLESSLRLFVPHGDPIAKLNPLPPAYALALK
jgi:hypothetical protein